MMLALALLAPPPATESIGLVGTSQGVPVKGILTRAVQPDRSLLSTLELTLMPPGQDPIIVRQETHLKSDGQPLRKLQSVVQGTTRTSFAATFDRREAQWQGPPGMPMFKVPAPRDTEIRVRSDFWFVNERPEVGAKWVYHRFVTDKGQWEATVVEYKGPVSISWNGQNVPAHRVVSGDAVADLDERGMPLQLETPQGKLTRAVPE